MTRLFLISGQQPHVCCLCCFRLTSLQHMFVARPQTDGRTDAYRPYILGHPSIYQDKIAQGPSKTSHCVWQTSYGFQLWYLLLQTRRKWTRHKQELDGVGYPQTVEPSEGSRSYTRVETSDSGLLLLKYPPKLEMRCVSHP